MINITTSEFIQTQTMPLDADTTPAEAYHQDLQHCLNDQLDWHSFSGTWQNKQADRSVGLVLKDMAHHPVNLYVYPNPDTEGNAKHPFTLDKVSGQAVILGEPQGVETYAILGLENAVLLYDGLMARDGGACVYTLPNGLKSRFIDMIKAFQPDRVITTHSQADELKDKIQNLDCKIVSIFSELVQVPATAIDSDWLDGVLFDDVQITQSDEAYLLQVKKAQLQAKIAKLAKLDDMELQLSIKDVVKEFGISKDKILAYVSEYKKGEFIQDATPYADAVKHEEIYQLLHELVDDHMIIDEQFKIAFVLWVLFSYLVEVAEFAPIAWISAPDSACGKSTLLSLFARVVNRPLAVTTITPAVLYRVTEQYQPTILLDEIDTWIKDKKDLLGLVNAGHSRTADQTARINSESHTVDVFRLFGARACAGIGDMPKTFANRSIKFALRRKTTNDRDTKRTNQYNLPRSVTDEIRAKAKRWAMDYRPEVEKVVIQPIGELGQIDDRDFDNWYILLQIAKVLGVYDEAVKACISISQVDHEPSLNEQLLTDIRDILGDRSYIGSTELIDRLIENKELPWATFNRGEPLSQYQMTKRLKSFGLSPIQKMINGQNLRRYDGQELRAVFANYLKPANEEDNSPFEC